MRTKTRKLYGTNLYYRTENKSAHVAVAKILATLIIAGVACTGVAAWVLWDNSHFVETIYPLSSDKVSSKIRVLLLTDLHEQTFGEHNRALISRVEKLKPDVILIAGDMINKIEPNPETAISLCKSLVQTAPVYYSLGNHENEVIFGSDMIYSNMKSADDGSGNLTQFIRNDSYLKSLEKAGVTVLLNEQAEIEVQGNLIDIGGINTNLSSMWPYSGEFVTTFSSQNPERYKILLCHRPEVVDSYLGDTPIDLCVSGHTHGGIVQIPGMGGLFTREQGFNPDLDSGHFTLNQTQLVVSRGLGGFPRLLNRPELVILDIS